MEKKKTRSLQEILDALKAAEKEFDEKLDKYGMKEVKQKKPKEGEENTEALQDDAPNSADTNNEQNIDDNPNSDSNQQ